MTLREQPGVPLTFRTEHASIPGASRHHAGLSSDRHLKDRSYPTNERHNQGLRQRHPLYDEAGDDEDETRYPTRAPSSARRYVPTTTPPRTVMRVTRHQGPPPSIKRASRHQTFTAEVPEVGHRSQRRWYWHPMVCIGIAMLVLVVGWIVLSSLFHWWQNEHETLTYGYPRTFQVDADVRHGGLSHFTVENLGGHILIIEVQVAHLAQAHLYGGPVFSGAGADLQPATLSFQDVNGDGYPDLVLAIGSERYVFINTQSGFRPATATDTLTGKVR